MNAQDDDLDEEFVTTTLLYTPPIFGQSMPAVGAALTGLPVGLGEDVGDEEDPPQYIRGRVLSYDGIGVSRTVFALRRSDGIRIGVALSDDNGWFTMRPQTAQPVVLLAIPLLDEKINCVVLDNILPVPD